VPVILLLLLLADPARASFHFARINQVVTSIGGDATIQFVEIVMIAGGQNLVEDTVLAAFDIDGQYIQDVLVVPSNVADGTAFFPWLMGTSAMAAAAGVTPDFIMPPELPTGGGMICWGAPGTVAPDPSTWDHTDPENYVDCLAYGSYSGPTNSKTGIPTPHDGDGHAMLGGGFSGDNLYDFVCQQDAFPQNNAWLSGFLLGTTPCPDSQPFTLSAPISFSGPGDVGTISGTIAPVVPSAADIMNQSVCIFDFCSVPFDGLFFRVTLDPGSDDLYYVVPRITPSAATSVGRKAGHLDDANTATRAPMGIIFAGGSLGVTFDDFDMGSQLQAGETSDVLFLTSSFGALAYYASLGPLTVDFQLSRFSLDPADAFLTSSTTVVPEPSSGLAAATAAGVVAFLAWRRRNL
jgi:MYXO-CTERM domain-containing protein